MWTGQRPFKLNYTLQLKTTLSAVTSFVSGIQFFQCLCPSSIFSTYLLFMSPHPWQHLGFVTVLLPSVTLKLSLKGVVDCTVAHAAVIQCYWGCYNSVLCDQEPHSPCLPHLVTNGISQTYHQLVSHTLRLWWDQLFRPFVFVFSVSLSSN